jgi:hypothetical protein
MWSGTFISGPPREVHGVDGTGVGAAVRVDSVGLATRTPRSIRGQLHTHKGPTLWKDIRLLKYVGTPTSKQQ